MDDKIFQILQLNVPNRNGVIYPKEVMENAVANFKIPSCGVFVGDEFTKDKFSHIIEGVWIDDDKVMANITVIPTTKGNDLAKLIDVGAAEFGIQGTGKVDENGVVSNFNFISVSAITRA